AFKTARRKGKPFVLHNHGSLMGYRSFVHGWRRIPYILYDMFHKRIALDADAVVVNTRQEYEEVQKFGVDGNKIHVIPVGIDTEDFRPAKKNWKELRLLFVGRISRDRNLEPVIKAVKLLSDRGIDAKLTIVGGAVKRSDAETGDYLTELKALVKRLDISKQVTFTGPKYGNARNRYYRNSDIFIYTSLWENFGQTILEAAAAGLPLICTRVGVAQDLIQNGKTGYLVGPDKPGEIAKAVSALKAKKKRSEIGKTLIRKVKTEFRWAGIIRKYMELYISLSKRKVPKQ
ncbi:glycosyltransferase family 4 protein, partial [Candidatus Woesearchaeota archaeon]|nr:glycosyltransferase family 4 protein [Candidatus Woesearchaeota archaeon]